MNHRHVMITLPAKLSVQNEQIMIRRRESNQETNEEVIHIPLEDVDSILIESAVVTVTAMFMAKCSEYRVVVFFCDDKHMPSTISLPFQQHSRLSAVFEMQLNLRKPLINRIWQEIVMAKIENQAACLNKLQCDHVDKMLTIAHTVQSADKTNREAYAARIYFSSLFNERFRRTETNEINAALNYGYAILRGLVARSIVVYGFMPHMGLFHHNDFNAFALADDWVEPFRPFFDYFVYINQDRIEERGLTTEIKRMIYSILSTEIAVGNENYNFSVAVERVIEGFLRCCKENDLKYLVFPRFLGEKE